MIQHQFYQPNWNYQQKTGFVVVNTEEEALRYPIAPGNSITFKVESQPIIVEKSMGFSQLDSPQVKRYRIVEEDPPKEEPRETGPEYALKEDVERLEEELQSIKAMISKRAAKKKEESDE